MQKLFLFSKSTQVCTKTEFGQIEDSFLYDVADFSSTPATSFRQLLIFPEVVEISDTTDLVLVECGKCILTEEGCEVGSEGGGGVYRKA